jgi:hypothetical protein
MQDAQFPMDASGIELEYPAYVSLPSNWLGHIPFAFWLMSTHKPRMVVELGLGSGNSYFAFQQSAQTLGLEVRFLGVRVEDGPSSRGAFEALREYHERRHEATSKLVSASLDDGLTSVADGTVDLMHINRVRAEKIVPRFDSWLPKMSVRGIILLHGIEQGDELKTFWAAISSRFRSFSFGHGSGLGVTYVGSEVLSGHLATLLDPDEAQMITLARGYFSRLGTSVVERSALHQAEAQIAALKAQIAGAPSSQLTGSHSAYDGKALTSQRDIALRILRQHTINAVRLEHERTLRNRLKFLMLRYAPRGLKRIAPPIVKRYLLRLISGG